jgi:protein-disulfide isomerase
MKTLVSVLISWIWLLSMVYAAYTPTAVDTQLIEIFSTKITAMHQTNPTKVQSIAPKLQVIVWMYSDETREHYVLNGLYLHIMSLLNAVNTVANQVAAPMPVATQPVPVVTPAPAPVAITSPVVSAWPVNTEMFPHTESLLDLISKSYIKGNPNAALTIVEFSDFQCPFCKSYTEKKTADRVIQYYNGKINFVFSHFPWPSHPLAQKAAEAAECVWAQWWIPLYHAFKDGLFAVPLALIDGGNWTMYQVPNPSREEIRNVFNQINDGSMSLTALETCIDSGEYEAKVQQSLRLAFALWASSTPSHVFINNTTGQYQLLNGDISLDSWIGILSQREPTL